MTHPQHIGFLSQSFKDLVQSDRYATFDNGMVRLIAGRYDIGALPPESEVTEDDLNQAKENLLTFAAVGFLDTFDKDLERFAKMFGWGSTMYVRYRTGLRPRVDAIDPEIIDAIEQRNKFDRELLDFARNLEENK